MEEFALAGLPIRFILAVVNLIPQTQLLLPPHFRRGLALILILLHSKLITLAGPLDSWRWRHPLPQGNTIDSIAYGNGLFVLLAINSTLVSCDASNWTNYAIPINLTGGFRGLGFGGGTFVAVGANGIVISSTNGARWESHLTGKTNHLKSIAIGNDRFVAVGDQGTILTSSNLVSWRDATFSKPLSFNEVGFMNGLFILVASDTNVLTSVNGEEWIAEAGEGQYPGKIAYGNQTFLISGSVSQVSHDGVHWVAINQSLNSVTFGGGRFIGVSYRGEIFTSSNGSTWTLVEPPGSSDDLSAVGYGNNIYVAGGRGGLLRTSNDGTNWITRSARLNNLGPLYAVHFGSDRFVAVGDWEIGPDGHSEASPMLNSSDGVVWARGPGVTGATLRTMAFGNGQFVALGSFGEVVVSVDGQNWFRQTSGPTWGPYAMTFGQGLFVAVGVGGEITKSSDGTNWSPALSPSSQDLWGVAYGDGLFVAVGHRNSTTGVILTSPDLSTWAKRTSLPLLAVAYHDKVYVTVGVAGSILTSTNAVDWIPRNSGTSQNLNYVSWGNGFFIAVGGGGTILVSANATDWISLNTGTDLEFHGAACGKNSFVVCGEQGCILQSACLNTLVHGVYSKSEGFSLEIEGCEGVNLKVQSSTDLRNWDDLITLTIGSGQTLVRDFGTTNLARKFYRAAPP